MRKILCFAAPALALVVALVLLWLVPVPTAISRAKFDRIREGMTEEEVEALLADPPECRTGKIPGPFTLGSLMGPTSIDWLSDEAIISVTLEHEAGNLSKPRRVTDKSYHPRPPATLLERLQRLWRRWS